MTKPTAMAKPPATVFYSWQSDLPNSTNRGFIEDCLNRAVKALATGGELQVVPNVTRDTKDTTGTKDIADTILAKIDECSVFVADVSLVGKASKTGSTRLTPNPNVILELGYAAKSITWDYVVPHSRR